MRTALGHHGLPFMFVHIGICLLLSSGSCTVNNEQKAELKLKVIEMFNHAYNSYMKYAYPADELMPLSCKGRYRGSEADRGDIDEALGNFSLTLIDSLDTLAVIGNIKEFERAVKLVVEHVSFNTDVVVSVFETNIRVLGGLLGAHSVALIFKDSGKGMAWYTKELLDMAEDVGDRLVVAFNTTTGIPYPKVNLKYGIHHVRSGIGDEKDTCTACGGTMLMEFGALSRLTGRSIFEEKARKAMESIWHFRSRNSDLVGTVINIHNGDWVRRDSGVGAGIDSYYEYCLKAYILLGDESYLQKFNAHYSAINKYIRQGSMLLDVLMHQPERPVRSFMDSLQAFWPGLQVLFGDIKPAIETHEMLYDVAKRHKFLPEAFTTNYDVYWAQHPLRPEFIESTYFLYEATKDPYYLEVGKHVIDTLQEYARVPCGFAAVKDVRILSHEDKMDSFVLAETFKYLYLMFSEESERVLNIHDFIFTTEAHLLPLWISNLNASGHTEIKSRSNQTSAANGGLDVQTSCPNTAKEQPSYRSLAEKIRKGIKKTKIIPRETCPNVKAEEKIKQLFGTVDPKREPKLRAEHFQVGNEKHVQLLKNMGIAITQTNDGKVQLMHQAAQAKTVEDAQDGIKFMQDMVQIAKSRGDLQSAQYKPRIIQVLSPPHNGKVVFTAGPSQFGIDLSSVNIGVSAEVVEVEPLKACTRITNPLALENRIALVERGDCMFIEKVREVQKFGVMGVIIIDHNEGTSSDIQPTFAMSGDSHPEDIKVAAVFLFRKEGQLLRKYMKESEQYLQVRIAARAFVEKDNGKKIAEPVENQRLEPVHDASEEKNQVPAADTEKVPAPVKITPIKDGNQEDKTTTKNRETTRTTKEEYVGTNNDGKMVKFVMTTSTTYDKEHCNGVPDRIYVSTEEEPLPTSTAQYKGSLFRKAGKLAEGQANCNAENTKPIKSQSTKSPTKTEDAQKSPTKTEDAQNKIHSAENTKTAESGEMKIGLVNEPIQFGHNDLNLGAVYDNGKNEDDESVRFAPDNLEIGGVLDGEEEEIVIPPGMVFCPEKRGPCEPNVIDQLIKNDPNTLKNDILNKPVDAEDSVDELQQKLKVAEETDIQLSDKTAPASKVSESEMMSTDISDLESSSKKTLSDKEPLDDRTSSGFVKISDPEVLMQDISNNFDKILKSESTQLKSVMTNIDNDNEAVICSSAGCFSSLNELNVFNKLAENVKRELHRMEVDSLNQEQQDKNKENEKSTVLSDSNESESNSENSKIGVGNENTGSRSRNVR